nr:pentatricopeptide repeat-containing protein At3g02650, mitochondrial [Ipomoea batatas]
MKGKSGMRLGRNKGVEVVREGEDRIPSKDSDGEGENFGFSRRKTLLRRLEAKTKALPTPKRFSGFSPQIFFTSIPGESEFPNTPSFCVLGIGPALSRGKILRGWNLPSVFGKSVMMAAFTAREKISPLKKGDVFPLSLRGRGEPPPPEVSLGEEEESYHCTVQTMEEATKSLKMMEDRGLKPDVYTYTVIISGYVKKLEMDEARKILDDAKKKLSKLSSATYHTLIRGYCKLEQFDQALALLREMKEHGVQPNADEYNKLIQSLCLNALNWVKAENLLEEMKGNRVHLNAITKGLIRAVKEMEQEELERKEMTEDA